MNTVSTHYMSPEDIWNHKATRIRSAADEIQAIALEMKEMSASETLVGTLLNAVDVFREYVGKDPDIAVAALVNARNEWHAPGTNKRHTDEVLLNEQFSKLDYYLSIIKHKILPHTVYHIETPVRMNGANFAECPICGRIVDSIHSFAKCEYCDSKLTW